MKEIMDTFYNVVMWANFVMIFWNIFCAELNMYYNEDKWYTISRLGTYISLSAFLVMMCMK